LATLEVFSKKTLEVCDIGGSLTLEVYKITYNLAEYKEYISYITEPFLTLQKMKSSKMALKTL
jgi:hypothetical protein